MTGKEDSPRPLSIPRKVFENRYRYTFENGCSVCGRNFSDVEKESGCDHIDCPLYDVVIIDDIREKHV